ncbi:MAG: exopolysaccharide biosynthesis protein, partial [Chthoniobacteraceae bacterium]|nr:exopolysaccharide biosynthesis protein [Chthoniobacteraceae bacterium]
MMTFPASRRLSEEIEALLEASRGRSLSVGEVAAMLHSRGFALLTMLLAAPFLVPSVPGLSTPFGAAIMALGAGLARGREPWLPGFVLRRELSPEMWGRILRALLKLVRRMERAARPRLLFLREGPGMTRWI